VTEPIPLSHIFVSALSQDAYDQATNHPSFLTRLLCDDKPILRQGIVYTSNVDMTVNGHDLGSSSKILKYRLDMTEPVLQGYAEEKTNIVISYSHVSEVRLSNADNLELSSDEDEGVEIDEAFLASSVVHTSFNPVSPANSQVNGGGILNPETNSSDVVFRSEALSNPQSSSQDSHTLYLRTVDLGRLGLLNGDWVSWYYHDRTCGSTAA